MKKLLVVFFTIALFSAKASFAQYYIVGATSVVNTINIDGNDDFYCEFVPTDDGYHMLSMYPPTDPFPHVVGVSYTFIDKNDNETGDTVTNSGAYAAIADFPGLDLFDYKFIEVEWTGFNDGGNYDDICDDFYF